MSALLYLAQFLYIYKNMKRIWFEDNCREEALKYEYLTDFSKGSHEAWIAARKYGYIKTYTWLKKGKSVGPWSIYAYEDTENKIVYVGLTNDVNKRHRGHKNGNLKHGIRKFDAVAQYFQSIEKPLPLPIIKMDDLDTEEDAQYYENWYVEAYKNIGWTVLNTQKTGVGKSSLGAGHKKWTEETLVKYVKKSKCKSRTDLKKINESAYITAYNLGIMDKLFPKKLHKDNNHWKVFENHVKEAEGCMSKKDYKKKNGSAYSKAYRYGFIDRLFPDNLRNEITEEELLSAHNYESRKDLKYNNPRLYSALKYRHLLDEYFPEKSRKPITEEDLEDAKNYSDRIDLRHNNKRLYDALCRRKLLDVYYPIKKVG